VLRSTANLNLRNATVALSQTLRFSGSRPQRYALHVEVAGGTQSWEAAFGPEGIVLTPRAGPKTRLTPEPPVFVLDHNVVSHYVWLYRQLRVDDDGARRAGTDVILSGNALVPQAMTALPLEVRAPVEVTLEAPGRAALVPARRYTLQLGDRRVRLYARGDTVFGVEFPAQDVLAHHSDLFPQSFSVAEETPAGQTLLVPFKPAEADELV